ncbi:hypothetical protein BGZ96_008872 [Linnemannia gamsii]|uniref:Uncharacterized protein n=1 Tax=Linnemannia gamsii TaxID=64522 RepID=A0ABQ7JXF3_9FUNG|nr:hypothetical protein BGZ96_008872 [Linnemannia gamsii]
MAAMVASVAAYPYQERLTSGFHELTMQNECIPGVSVKEYHPFRLVSTPFQAGVSKLNNSNRVIAAYSSQGDATVLDLCVVSSELGCMAGMPSNCIYDNVEYRFRVESPVKGYLKVEGDGVIVVDSFHEGSGLNFFKLSPDAGLMIAHMVDGEPLVFQTHSSRQITLNPPVKGTAAQLFTIVIPNEIQHPTCLD